MQIQIKDIEEVKKVKVFHPFKIELLIEDESDLEDLAVRFNANSLIITERHGYNGYKATCNNGHVWARIHTLLQEKPYMK